MRALLSPLTSGLIWGSHLLAAIARGEETSAPDFFDIIGTPPAEVAASLTRPAPIEDTGHLLSGFIGLPMSTSHRKDFADGLRATLESPPETHHFAVHCLVDLLEEEGRFDEAIALVRSNLRESDDSRIREAGLLWKAGKPGDATDLALRVSPSSANERAWLSIVKVDLIQGRPEEATRQLGFFHQLAGLSPRVRHLLAIQHVEIARQQGQADALIAASPSSVHRAVWNSVLGRKEQALEAVRDSDPGVAAGEIELLARALPGEPLVAERAATILARQDLPLEERRSLLGAFGDTRQRFTLWSTMSGGHGETVDVLESVPSPRSHDEGIQDRRICVDLMTANPGDAGLKWLVATMDPDGPQQAGPLLIEVARAFREAPRGDSIFADPAKKALEILARTGTPEELRTLVVDAPGFAELPPQVRLRYLMAADLDLEVVATVKALKFDEPSEDLLGGQLRQYLERRSFAHVIPDEVLALLMERLPEMVVGSPSKPDFHVRDHTGSWLTFFGSHASATDPQIRAIHRLVAAAGARGPETRAAVLAGLPDFVWTMPGLTLEKPPVMAKRPVATKAPAYLALSIFTPPDPAVIGQGTHALQRYRSPTSSMLHRDPAAVSLLANSPWEQNLRGVEDPARFDPAVQAKLRMLFDKSPSRTLIYDLLVTSGVVECPDPAVKATAEGRIAGFDPMRQDDPTIALYLFFHRLAKRAPLDDCLPLLEGQKNFTRPSRERAMMRAMNVVRLVRQGIEELVRERMGFEGAAPLKKPPGPLQPPSAYDRLQFFREAGKTDSPEAIALAREVLFNFARADRAVIYAEENISISTLVAAGQFPAFLEELKAKLEAAGRSELEVQRALYRVHLYRIVHAKGEGEPFARRVFELDPSDMQAAREVLGAAIRADDPALALRCLEALGRKSHVDLLGALNASNPGTLGLFSGPRARELADALLRIRLARFHHGYVPPERPSFLPLYLHIARHDPASLKPLLRWARALTPGRGNDLLSIAQSLREVLSEAEVLDLLAEAWFTPTPQDAPDAIRFPAKGPSTDPESFNLAEYARSGWAKRLSEVAANYPPSDSTAGPKVLLQLAADPTPETWDRLVPGHVATLPVATRDPFRRNLEMQVRNLPDAAALQIFLAKRPASPPQVPPTLDSILQKVLLAAKAGDRSGIPAFWESAKKLFPAETEPRRLDFIVRSANSFAILAEPPVWTEFVDLAQKSEGFAGQWLRRYSNVHELSSSPVRVADLARVILPQLEPDPQLSATLIALFDLVAATEAPDLEVLKKFRPWIDESVRRQDRDPTPSSRAQWLDLLSSDLAAVCPQISATPGPDTMGSVDWSLAGVKGFRSGYPSARPFPYLDGQFDLEFLAGPAPERLTRITTVAKAPATGRLKLKLPEDAKFISLLARQSEGGIVRWSHPVAISFAPQEIAVELRPVTVGKPGSDFPSAVLPAGGPFLTEDALQFELPPGVQVELARLPWTVGDVPVVSGWIQKSGGAGTISLSFRTGDDLEIGSQTLGSGDEEVASMPLWQRFKTPASLRVPAETVSIALVYRPGYSSVPSAFRVSAVRMVPPKIASLPAGFTLLGRIPGEIGQIAFDSQANRFAAPSARSGVGVFDLATREFSGWIPLGDPERRRGADIVWMALAGDRLVCVERNGDVYLVSVARRSAKLVRKIQTMTVDRPIPYPVRLSPGGDFLAWSGMMAGVRIAKLGDDGIEAERLLETGRIHWMDFKPANHSLEAVDGDKTYTLDLAAWRTAALAVRPNGEEEVLALREMMNSFDAGRTWVDPVHQVTFTTGSESGMPSGMDPVNRSVLLPRGLVAGDGESKPFFISNFGQVLRIEPSKLKGYQPPGE